MPMPGYVNVATSLKAEEAQILKTKLAEEGFTSLHSFLRHVIQNGLLTSNFTSKNRDYASSSFSTSSVAPSHVEPRAGLDPATPALPRH